MGLLTLFANPAPSLRPLPTGSFTVDCTGRLVMGTVPSSFPGELVAEVAQSVLAAFRGAGEADLPLSEVVVDYASLRITARELRGGAIIFFAPKLASAPGTPL